MMNLGLGTVQFGCNYGISNTKGQVSIKEVEKILECALQNNIDIIDTAFLYGNSEEVLGQFDLSKFKITTKTPKADINLSKIKNLDMFKSAFNTSLERLRVQNVYSILVHEANDLLGNLADDLYIFITNLKKTGLIKKIGVSVYTPEQLQNIINKYDVDLVQLPLNILDQRFIPILKNLKLRNIEIHTRSTFLQGLLLLEDTKINSYFDEINHLISSIPYPRLTHALHFVNNIKEVDKIIVGTTSQKELEEIVSALKQDINVLSYDKYAVWDEKYIMPQNWRL